MNENTMPLKWHKFLIYFSLWAGAILTLGYSAAFFTGAVYGEVGRRFYQVFPLIQWLDIAYGLVLAALAAYQIYTRFQLAGFRKDAPKKFLNLHVATFITTLAYVLCFAVMATRQLINLGYPDAAERVWYFVGKSFWQLLSIVIMFLINKKYYDKRKELFVN